MSDAAHVRHQEALRLLLREFDRVCRELRIPYVLFAGTLLGAVRHGDLIPWDDDLDVLMLRSDYQRFLKEAPQHLDPQKFYLQAEFSEHWPMFFSKLRLNGTTCLEPFHPRDKNMHQGIYIDLFPCDAAAPSPLGRRLQFWASKVVIAKCLYRRGYDTPLLHKKLAMQVSRLLPLRPLLRLVRKERPDSALVHTFLAGARSYRKNVFPRRWLRPGKVLPFAGNRYPVPDDCEALLAHIYGDYRSTPSEEERIWKRHGILVDTERSWETYRDYRDGMVFPVQTRSIR